MVKLLRMFTNICLINPWEYSLAVQRSFWIGAFGLRLTESISVNFIVIKIFKINGTT